MLVAALAAFVLSAPVSMYEHIGCVPVTDTARQCGSVLTVGVSAVSSEGTRTESTLALCCMYPPRPHIPDPDAYYTATDDITSEQLASCKSVVTFAPSLAAWCAVPIERMAPLVDDGYNRYADVDDVEIVDSGYADKLLPLASTMLMLELVAGGLTVWTPEYTVIGHGTASCDGRTVAVFPGDQLRLVRRLGPGRTATAVLVRHSTLYRISAIDRARFVIKVAQARVVGGQYTPAELDSRGMYDLLPSAAGE